MKSRHSSEPGFPKVYVKQYSYSNFEMWLLERKTSSAEGAGGGLGAVYTVDLVETFFSGVILDLDSTAAASRTVDVHKMRKL